MTRLFSSIPVSVLILAFGAIRLAQAQSAVEFDLPAQPLSKALHTIGDKLNTNILFDPGQVQGITAPAIKGPVTIEQALTQVLAGTQLRFKFMDDRTVSLMAVDAKTTSAVNFPESSRLAQTEAGFPEGQQDSEKLEEVIVDIPEILVTGRKTLNMDIRRTSDDVQPYVVFNREELEKSGARNVEDFLKMKLTASGTAVSSNQVAGAAAAGSQLSLRGLSVNETLILVDGHRKGRYAFSGTPQQPDLNGIPVGAIERIEVLPTTAAGIFGGDATGGAINVVLRRDYDGVEGKLTYDSAFAGGGGRRQVDINSGFNLENGRTNILLAAQYSDSDPLLTRERDFTERARALVLANNPDGIFSPFLDPILGATTNIRSADGSDLTLAGSGAPVGSPYTFVPQDYSGVGSDGGQAFIDNAGRYNLSLARNAQFTGGGAQGLLNATIRKSIMATVRREFTPGIQAYIDASAADNNSRFVFNNGSFSSSFTVPGGAAVNPFNEDVVVTTPILGLDEATVTRLRELRAVGGVLIRLPKTWRAALSYTWNRTRFENKDASLIDIFDFSPTGAPAAVSDGAVNVFRDTNRFGADFSPYVLSGGHTSPTHSTLQDASLLVSGPLWSLPGGAINLSASLAHRRENFGETVTVGTFGDTINYPRNQTVDSIYMETKLPLVSQANQVPGVRLLELQVAGRWDEYESIGSNTSFSFDPQPRENFRNTVSSVDPTVGLRYQFVPDVTFRVSYNTGFLVPALNQLSSFVRPANGAIEGLFDPVLGEPVGFYSSIQDGQNLKPEQSEGWTAGVIFEPRFVPGLRFSLDWLRLEKTDNISFLPFFTEQSRIDNESLVPGLIVRGDPAPGDAAGSITAIRSGVVNIARRTVEAFDLAFDYRMATTRTGNFTLATRATRNLHNRQQLLPNLPVTELIGNDIGELKWKGHTTLTWDYRNWAVAWTTNYFHSYRISEFAAENYGARARFPSQTYHDVFASYRFGAQPRWNVLANAEIDLGIQNVFDRDPPIEVFSPSFGPFYNTWADPRLASYSISLKKAF